MANREGQGGKRTLLDRIRPRNWSKGTRVTLSAFLVVLIVAMLFPSPKLSSAKAETPEITLKAGESTDTVFTYEPKKAKTDSLIAGSEQPEIAVIHLDRFTPGRMTCKVDALKPGTAKLNIGVGEDILASVTVTVTE